MKHIDSEESGTFLPEEKSPTERKGGIPIKKAV